MLIGTTKTSELGPDSGRPKTSKRTVHEYSKVKVVFKIGSHPSFVLYTVFFLPFLPMITYHLHMTLRKEYCYLRKEHY